MAFTLILLWTILIACPTWTDGVYSDPPVYQISCLSYLDRWRLLWSSCGPDQLLVLPGHMAFTLILLWTRSPDCPTWTDSVYSDSPVDQITACPIDGQMEFIQILLWTRSTACLTWTDGVYSGLPVDQISCLSYLDRWRLLWSSCRPE